MVQINGIYIFATWHVYLLSLCTWLVSAQSIASQAYTPVAEPCLEGFELVRMAGSSAENQILSASEAAYVHARRSQVIPQAWKAYLANVETTNVPLPSYVSGILNGSISEKPNMGIAMSGGGYRAAIFGAGMLNALDGRNDSSNHAGLGGLLQASTYLSGLSGGAWLTTSLVQANFPMMQELIFANPPVSEDSWGGWNANYSLFAPSGNPSIDAEYLVNLVEELKGKYAAGYTVTFADYWGRALARHFVNGTFPSNFYDESYTHGAGLLWSSVVETESFKAHAIPFPIVVSDISVTGQNESNVLPGDDIPISNPIIEFNVFEMGSFDPMLSAFTPTKFLGTRNTSICITNYDQLSLVAGSSSDLFNEVAISSIPLDTGSSLGSLLSQSGIQGEVASWPNPFYGIQPETFVASNQTNLSLVDGGEDGEVIPLAPLLVKARGVDTILAIDASSDIDNFAYGSSLIATQDRVMLLSSAYSFPPVPTSVNEFNVQGLSTRPTFFGCDTTSTNEGTPFVIYLANGGPPRDGEPPLTNTSTFQLVYDFAEIQGMLDQTSVIATQGYPVDSTMRDPEWPACLACAIVDRARQRTGATRTGVCESCFMRYCWSGSTLGT